MSKHPGPEEFVWYTRDGLSLSLQDWPSDRVRSFEEHVAGCDLCGRKLAQEAETELLLSQLAETPNSVGSPILRTWMYATAAAVALFVGIGVRGSSAETPSHSQNPATISFDAGVRLADGDIPSSSKATTAN